MFDSKYVGARFSAVTLQMKVKHKKESEMHEVECKFEIVDRHLLLATLQDLNAQDVGTEQQRDEYWAHPNRDFAASDEALRTRHVGDRLMVTYKGPKLPGTVKSRREIELEFAPNTPPTEIHEMWLALGFKAVATIHKHRQKFKIAFDERNFEIAIDEVTGVGQFVEVETVVPQQDSKGAIAAIEQLCQRINLVNPIRDSYLALWLGRRDG